MKLFRLFRSNPIPNMDKRSKMKQRIAPIGNNPIWEILLEAFYEYAENTKLGGLYYLRKGITSGYTRFLWIVIPISVFFFGALLVFELVSTFYEKPTVMVMVKSQPVQHIPFPGITYCHPQTVIDYKTRSFVSKLVIPAGVTDQQVLDVMPSIGMFVENQWGNIPNMQELLLIDETLKLNNYTLPMAVEELGLSCKDFIQLCAWSKVEFPCFQENSHFSFVTTTSYLGICCSFNYRPANTSYVPFHSQVFGTRGGLTIVGSGHPQVADGKSGVLFSSGFIMMVHHPKDFPVEGNQIKLIEIGVVTTVAVSPTLSLCTDDVLALPPKSRRCVQPNDMNGFEYRQPACDVECTRDYIYRTCGCHPFYLPYTKGENSVRDCLAVDAACFSEHMSMIIFWIRHRIVELKKGQCNNCLPSCTDVTYISRSYSNAYSSLSSNFNVQPIYKNTSLTSSHFTVHVYLANQLVRVQTQMIVTSLINLVSNFGGIFNLCLGISVLTIVELFFHAFRLPQRIATAKQTKSPNVFLVRARPNKLQIYN